MSNNLIKNDHSKHHRVSSIFCETSTAKPYGQGFIFPFRNPVEHVVGWRIRSVVIYAYSGIDTHPLFVLLSDLVPGQSPSFWNGQGISIAKIIVRNRVAGITDSIYLKDPNPEWHYMLEQDINNIQFELRDEQLKTVNTNFLVEVEIKHAI